MVIKVQHKSEKIYPIEKIISIFSYFTTGIVGFFWFVIAYFKKTKVRPFLMYNIVQSVLIGIFLAIFNLATHLILLIFSKIQYLDYIAAKLYYNVLSFKIIKLYGIGISFTALELLLFIFLTYISVGVLIGKNFHVPFLSNIVKKAMKNY